MQSYRDSFLEKINSKEITVGVIGLGYVGLPLSLLFAREKIKTIGFDIDSQKVKMIEQGESYIRQYSSEKIAECKDFLFPTNDFTKIKEVDAIIICVPTPLSKHREPDLSYIENTLKSILPHLKKGQILSLESTTYPGTCEEIIRPQLEKNGYNIGDDFYLVFSPEREDPGRSDFNTKNTPKVCGGSTSQCLELGSSLYSLIIDHVVEVSSTKAAELTKLLENIHRAVNIGLVNEMKIIADKMNIDIFEVIEAAATKPFGFVPYFPGPGLGGHCIPIDPFYLTWKSKEFELNTKFIELAGEINTSMPEYVINKTIVALNNVKKSINGSKILILGIAYKPNVDDTRESPSMVIMEKLKDLGADIYYNDPYVPTFPKKRDFFFDLNSTELTKENLDQMDCVIMTTNHNLYDLDFLYENCRLIVDTRGAFKKGSKVIRA